MAPLDWGSANDAITLLTPARPGFTIAYRPLFSPNVPTEQAYAHCLIDNVHLIRWSPNCRSIAVCDILCVWVMDLKGQSLKMRHEFCFDAKPNDIVWESNTSFWVATNRGVEKINLAGDRYVITKVRANAIAWDGNSTLVVGSNQHISVFNGSSLTREFKTNGTVTVVDVWRGSIAYGTADGTVGMISVAGNDSRDVSDVDGPVMGVMWNVGGRCLAVVGRESVSIFKRDGTVIGTCIQYDSIGALRDPRRVRIAVVTDNESLAVYEVFKDKIPKKAANDRSPLAKSLR